MDKSQIIRYQNKIKSMFPIRSQIKLGRWRFLSFIVIDLFCLVISNLIASRFYLSRVGIEYSDHYLVLVLALIIDVFVTLVFNTLDRVLRRNPVRELFECIKHVLISFVGLSLCLFATKSGADYSRVVVFSAYIMDLVLIYALRTAWKLLLSVQKMKSHTKTALVVTANNFANEAIDALKEKEVDVKNIYLLRGNDVNEIEGIPVAHSSEEAASAICWDQIDEVYIYGLDDQAVPDVFIDMCQDMGIRVDLVDFGYRLINIKGITAEKPEYGSLNFLESRRDIPFRIRRVYWITETDANLHRGFHAHKLNCQLLFCPYGSIDIILDDGYKKETVRLDDPSKGLILMPGLWREMIWQEKGSVLCVLASEFYDADEYIRNYDEFLQYSRQYHEA